jgi:hypothetical protein
MRYTEMVDRVMRSQVHPRVDSDLEELMTQFARVEAPYFQPGEVFNEHRMRLLWTFGYTSYLADKIQRRCRPCGS